MARKIQPVEKCDCEVIHEETVNQVREKMPEEETLYDLAEGQYLMEIKIFDEVFERLVDSGLDAFDSFVLITKLLEEHLENKMMYSTFKH